MGADAHAWFVSLVLTFTEKIQIYIYTWFIYNIYKYNAHLPALVNNAKQMANTNG